MSSIETAIYAKLYGTAGIAALVSTRIYPGTAPANPTKPFIDYEQLPSHSLIANSGPVGLCQSLWQVNCWASTLAGARTLANLVRNNLKTHAKATWDTIVIHHCMQVSESDLFEESADNDAIRANGKALEFDIWFEESTS